MNIIYIIIVRHQDENIMFFHVQHLKA